MIRRIIATMLAAVLLVLGVCPALADSAQPAGFLAPVENGAYFKLDDALIRVDGDAASLVAQGAFVSVAAVGQVAYALQYGEDFALDLVKYAPGTDAEVLYEFQGSDRVSHLTVQGEELFVLLNDQLHVIYPSNRMCIKLANTAMAEYVWLNGMVYFVAAQETVTHTLDSLLGGEPVQKTGGVLYSLDLNTGSMLKLLGSGIEDLSAGGEYLYFHDLSDAYVMGTADQEWLEGRLYCMDPAIRGKVRVLDGYDWGFYPMAEGVGVYTAEGVSVMRNDGVFLHLMVPKGVIDVAAHDGGLYVFDHSANALYCYDGDLTVVAADALKNIMEDMGRKVENTEPKLTIVATQAPGVAPFADLLAAMTAAPTIEATAAPSAEATAEPTAEATAEAAAETTAEPTAEPTAKPTAEPTAKPTAAPTAEPTAKPTVKPTDSLLDDSYIFPDSDKRKLTKEEIKKVDKSLWAYGRNEIYARHGYYFGENSKYQTYFEGKSWYWAGDFSTSELNSIEWYNMQLLKEMEGITGTASSGSSSGSSSGTSSGYIFANSSSKKLTRKQILAIDKDLWPYARNEIYARHGYSFKTAKFRNYFRKKSWYKEGGFSTSDLNSIEWYNMNLLKQMEKEYGVK